MKVKSLSRVRLFATPWTAAYQAPLSMGFSRQEYWSRLPFPSPGDLPDPGIEPGSSGLQADALPSEPPGDWNKKVGGQEIPGVTDKFDLGVKNEAGQGLKRVLLREHLVTSNSIFQQYKDDSTHGHYQMVNTKIRLIIFFAAEDGEDLYSQGKQDLELTVAQLMSSLLQNPDLNCSK